MEDRLIEERLIGVVAKYFDVERSKVTRDSLFVKDLGADSLDVLELIMKIEEEFGINIPDDKAKKILTVGQAADYVVAVKGTLPAS